MDEGSKKPETTEEAGRKGGKTTSKTHGHEFYKEIGHMGGQTGGKKGGKTTSEKFGHEFYQEIGKRGGQTVKRLVEEGKEEKNK